MACGWSSWRALSDPGLVPQTVTEVLALKEQQGKSLTERLTQYLRPKRLLLVLDNAEHLLAACARLTETVLRQCPQVTLLVTSRERPPCRGSRPIGCHRCPCRTRGSTYRRR